LGTLEEDDELLRCLENKRLTYAKLLKTSSEAKYLQEIKSQYEQYLREAKNSPLEDVPELIQQLCGLPIKGQEIKQAVDKYEETRCRVIAEGNKSKRGYLIVRVFSGVSSFFINRCHGAWEKTSDAACYFKTAVVGP